MYGDIPRFISVAEMGRLGGTNRQMSVYRMNPKGVTQIDTAPDYRGGDPT